jgi:hypothetical protein
LEIELHSGDYSSDFRSPGQLTSEGPCRIHQTLKQLLFFISLLRLSPSDQQLLQAHSSVLNCTAAFVIHHMISTARVNYKENLPSFRQCSTLPLVAINASVLVFFVSLSKTA